MKTNTCYTWGYESRDTEDLFEICKAYKIKFVVDVRLYAYSANPIWSYNILERRFKHNTSTKYIHIPALGNKARGMGNPQVVWQPPNDDAAYESLMQLKELLQEGNILLMCREPNYKHCHRSIVSEELKNLTECNIYNFSSRNPKKEVRQLSFGF